MAKRTKRALPSIEADTTINAIYIRFSSRRVAHTEVLLECQPALVNVDFDNTGSVIGIEVIKSNET
jgi:uncharacterized protein YuzE